MTPRKPCPRCGVTRTVRPDRDPTANPHRLCGDCLRVEPGWPTALIEPCSDARANPKPFIDPDDLADGLLGVVKLLAAAADRISDHRVRAAAANARRTCGQCGCLTFSDEPCPGCIAAENTAEATIDLRCGARLRPATTLETHVRRGL